MTIEFQEKNQWSEVYCWYVSVLERGSNGMRVEMGHAVVFGINLMFQRDIHSYQAIPFRKQDFDPGPWVIFACFFICWYVFTCHTVSLHLHPQTCFIMYSNNCFSLPPYMKKNTVQVYRCLLELYLFLNSLLGLDITFPCLLALLSCFSPQLVSNLPPLFFPSVIIILIFNCLSLFLTGV